MKLKLYLLTQNEHRGYDTYDSCVVCAKNADDAKTINPDGDKFIEGNDPWNTWATKLSSISCTEIGIANKGIERGVIVASFNAG
jgi:hypothetical protein